MKIKLGWSKEDHDKEDAMNSPEVRAGFYEVIDLDTDEQHGSYATLDEARAAVRYDRLKAYAIWRDNVRVECCEPYEGDDDRVKQALGLPNESEIEDDATPLDPMARHLA
jgi:hypothetical protein